MQAHNRLQGTKFSKDSLLGWHKLAVAGGEALKKKNTVVTTGFANGKLN